MSKDVATRKDIDEVLDLMRTFMQQVDERFNRVEEEISDLKASLDRLVNTIDGLIARIDKYKTELATRGR